MKKRIPECIRDPVAKKDGLGDPRPPRYELSDGYFFLVVSDGLTDVLSQAPALAVSLAAEGLGA
jgi:hypothetical protein